MAIPPKELQRVYNRTPKGMVTQILKGARYRAKKRGYDLSISRDWVREKVKAGICEATNVNFTFENFPAGEYNPWSPSVDRIDNTKGYTQDNCQIVVSMYNMAKNVWTEEQVLNMARELVAKHDRHLGTDTVH